MKSLFRFLLSYSFFELIFLSLIAVFLLFSRIYITQSVRFIFLLWNLFLAWIPYIAILVVVFCDKKKSSFIIQIPLLLIWFIFFPNAPYILTDFVHLKEYGVPLWYDIALLSSFSFNGLFLGFISLYQVHILFSRLWGKVFGWCFISFTLLLSSFGIYLGRYLRWNSWDVITDPIPLGKDILGRILFPLEHISTYGVTGVFFLILLATYLVFISLSRNEK